MTARGIVSDEEKAHILALKAQAEKSAAEFKAAVLDLEARSSVRAAAAAAEISTNTVTRWKRGE